MQKKEVLVSKSMLRIGGQVTLAPVVRTTKKTINNTCEKKERTSTKQLATVMSRACHVRRPRQSMLPPQPSAQTISCRQLKTVMINEAEVVVPLRPFSLLGRDLNFYSSLHPSRMDPQRWPSLGHECAMLSVRRLG